MQTRQRGWTKAIPWIIAGLSLLVNVAQWRDAKAERTERAAARDEEMARKIDVNLLFPATVADEEGLHAFGLVLEALNPSYQDMYVSGVGFRLPDGSIRLQYPTSGDPRPPCDLPKHRPLKVLVAGPELTALCEQLLRSGQNGTVTLVGFCIDGLNTTHTSEPLEFDIDEALALANAGDGGT